MINNPGPDGSLRREAVKDGCATLVLEAGEVWKVEPPVVEYAMRGIKNVLVGLGMIEGEVVQPPYRLVAEETKWMRAEYGGFLQFHVAPGNMVSKGAPIVTNTSLVGRHHNVLTAPNDAIVLSLTTMPAVSPGDPVAHLAFPSETAFKKMERVIGKLPEDGLLSRLRDALATNVLVSELDDDFG